MAVQVVSSRGLIRRGTRAPAMTRPPWLARFAAKELPCCWLGRQITKRRAVISRRPDSLSFREDGFRSRAVFSDLNGDGYPELILACEWGPIRVFQNDRGRLREVTGELGLDTYTGLWNSVAVGDFDGDGRMDIVAGN